MPRLFERNRLDLDRFFKNDPDLNRFFTIPRDPFMQNRGSFFRHSMPEDLDDDPIHPNTDIQSFSHESTQSQIMITDVKGTLELNETNGKKSSVLQIQTAELFLMDQSIPKRNEIN